MDNAIASPSSASRPHRRRLAVADTLAGRVSVVLALQVIATVVAIIADWRTCFDHAGAARPVSSAFAAHGSAISAPLAALVLLAAGGLLTRARGRWSWVGAGAVCLVALAMIWGAIGEVASSPSVFTPRAVLVVSCVFGLGQALWLLDGARRR
jgi:hypothetical protein